MTKPKGVIWQACGNWDISKVLLGPGLKKARKLRSASVGVLELKVEVDAWSVPSLTQKQSRIDNHWQIEISFPPRKSLQRTNYSEGRPFAQLQIAKKKKIKIKKIIQAHLVLINKFSCFMMSCQGFFFLFFNLIFYFCFKIRYRECGGSRWEEKWGRTWSNREQRNHYQNILYEKIHFL